MELYYKPTGEYVTVYHISEDINGYPVFLVYINNQWSWEPADRLSPNCEEYPFIELEKY